MTNALNISFIGAGNVATHLARHLFSLGHNIKGIYSRTLENAQRLAEQVNTIGVSRLDQLPNADIYFFTVPDSVLPSIITQFASVRTEGIWVHTAGCHSLSVFPQGIHCGVLYPLQTFTKDCHLNLHGTPIFFESDNASVYRQLEELAFQLSGDARPLGSSSRALLHLAAVFGCNFSNHCYTIAENLLKEAGIDEKVLLPLISETARKVRILPAREAQTGPAIRNDLGTIETHRSLLSERPELLNLYNLMTSSIQTHLTNNKTSI